MARAEVPTHPRLRPVEAFPVKIEGTEYLCLRDPQDLAAQPVFLNRFMVFLVSRMDGTNSLRDIQADFARATGEILPMQQIEELVQQLDDYRLLESERFLGYLSRLESDFRNRSRRPAQHAGSAYPAEPEALVRTLDSYFDPPEGPGRDHPSEAPGPVRGLVAPHIDLQRGGPIYAHAYSALRNSTARRFIIFGTCHGPMEKRFALTAKDFETPLGVVETDRTFVDRLASRLEVDYFHDEFAHRGEHSIEFQVVCLRHLLRGRQEFKIIPILVGSFHDVWTAGEVVPEESEIAKMLRAVRDTMDELPQEYCVVAGADLAHVGRRFGDPSGPSAEELRTVGCKDREFLSFVEAGDADGMFRSIARERDRRRVCGYPPIYMTLRCVGNPKGRLLQYRQWSDLEGGAAVTFAALALY